MLKKLISHLFSQNNKDLLKRPSLHAEVDIPSSITRYFDEILQILELDSPTVLTVATILKQGELIDIREKIAFDEKPISDNYLRGFTYYEENKVFLAHFVAGFDKQTHSIQFFEQNEAEKLFVLAHELRHLWQRKYNSSVYDQKSAYGRDVIHDIAEIDADAFAIAYVFSEKTNYISDDFQRSLVSLFCDAALDNGKRWSRAFELLEQYQLGGSGKISNIMNILN